MQMLMSTLGCDVNARLVCDANADVMLAVMLAVLYSTGGKRAMHARGGGGKMLCKLAEPKWPDDLSALGQSSFSVGLVSNARCCGCACGGRHVMPRKRSWAVHYCEYHSKRQIVQSCGC